MHVPYQKRIIHVYKYTVKHKIIIHQVLLTTQFVANNKKPFEDYNNRLVNTFKTFTII